MRRRDFLAIAASGVLPLVCSKRVEAEEGTGWMQELKADTAPLSSAWHSVIKSCGGMLRLRREDGFTRITIDKADVDGSPFGACAFQKPSFDLAQNPVLDLWIRACGNHSMALDVAFGEASPWDYGIGPPYGPYPYNHVINITGRQIRPDTSSLGDLGPINDGKWHHIVFDLAFAVKSRLGFNPEKIRHASLNIGDWKDSMLLYSGGPPQPLPATIDLRDIELRPPRPNETYLNDLVLDARVSSLGKSSTGEHRYLVAGSVISRNVLEEGVIAVGNVQGKNSYRFPGQIQGREDFSLITTVRQGVSELPVKLFAAGKVVAAKPLPPPPSLTYLQNASINLIPSSHLDVVSLDTEENTFVWWREKIIGPAIALLEKHPDYRFTVEITYALMDYLSHRPFHAEAALKFMKKGRLSCGAMHTMPYQSVWSGESLLRQLYYGRKWLREHVGKDIPCFTAWNTDTPETALQFPQILAKSGVKYLMEGRFRPGLFEWYSPDGSKVIMNSLGIYGDLVAYFEPYPTVNDPAANTMQNVALQVPELLQYWDRFYQTHRIPPEIPVTDMKDQLPPTKQLIPLVDEWKAGGRQKYGAGFKIKFATADEFMDAVTRNPETRLPALKGEWVNPWGYVMPTHPRMIQAGRKAEWALTSAEKFWALRYMALASLHPEPYQKGEFDDAWMAHIHYGHSSSGLNGTITDRLLYAYEKRALILGTASLKTAVQWIAVRATPLDQQSLKLVVFNPLSWPRSGPTLVEIPVLPGEEPEILDARGNTLSSQRVPQVLGGTTRYVMEARDIPSIGYSTFKVRFKPPAHPGTPRPVTFKTQVYENKFYRLQFVPGGLKSIYDKHLRKELLNPEDFLGGEIFSLDSYGGDSSGPTGHGEVAQPSWQRIERASQYSPTWDQIESGTVRAGWKMEQPFKDATVRLKLYAYQESKRLEFEVSILHWSQAIFKEFRMAMPCNIPDGQVAYEVPYGVLEVGRDELREAPWPGGFDDVPCNETHPRFVQNWISASDKDFTVVLSSCGTACDYLDAHEKKDRFTLLQPILFASRESGDEQGNYFVPPGDYHYRFALTSFAGGWRNNIRFGDEVNCPFPATVIGPLYGAEHDRVKGRINAILPPLPENPQGPVGYMSAMLAEYPPLALPSSLSLCRVSVPNYVVSDIKVADDGEGYIVRGYEITGQDVPVTLTFPLAIQQANATNLIEEDLPQQLNFTAGEVRFEAGHRSINALRLKGKWKP